MEGETSKSRIYSLQSTGECGEGYLVETGQERGVALRELAAGGKCLQGRQLT